MKHCLPVIRSPRRRRFDGVRLAFINSHFAAHDEKVKRRNEDFHRIKRDLFTAAANRKDVVVAAPSKSEGVSLGVTGIFICN